MELEAWYDVEADDPAILTTAAEVDALLDRMVSDSLAFDVPPLVELSFADVVAYVGVDAKRQRGFITYNDTISATDDPDSTPVEYDYMGNVREIPAYAEIPLSDVRTATLDLLTGRPSEAITWRTV